MKTITFIFAFMVGSIGWAEEQRLGAKPESEKWIEYSNVDDVTSTSDWFSYGGGREKKSFSMKHPSEWSFSGGVFVNHNDAKVAETLPGIVALKDGQKCHDDLRVYQGSNLSPMKSPERDLGFVSVKKLTINKHPASLLITERNGHIGGRSSGPLARYVYHYCLENGKYAFGMMFYAYQKDSPDRALFEKVLSTVELKNTLTNSQKTKSKPEISPGDPRLGLEPPTK